MKQVTILQLVGDGGRKPACRVLAAGKQFTGKSGHMYAPGVRRHIRAAFKLGATMEEVMEVLKLCVVQGVQACNLAVPILAEELDRSG